MKKFKADIDIMPLEELLDPRGRAILSSMNSLGIHEASEIRLGRHIRLHIKAETKEIAFEKVKEACEKLLANKVMETYKINLKEEE